MPTLIPRTGSPHLFRQLATNAPSCLHAHARCRHDSAAAESRQQQQASLEEDVNDDTPPLRVRKHGFRSLPLSPLMRGGGAKKPRKRSVASPSQHAALKEFQKEVALNPYAQALATPVRFCTLTLARLPSHFLLPFTTTIEKSPPATEGHLPKVKARLQSGQSADYTEETLAQTSYVINRQDIVRHLSRRKHWTTLITERQKAKLASIAQRSASAQKLIHDHWVWENQVDATTKMLERDVVEAVTRAVKVRGLESDSSAPWSADCAFALVFDHQNAQNHDNAAQVEAGVEVYDLTTLLSPDTLSALKTDLAHDSRPTIYIPKTQAACNAQLALDRLKVYTESNDIVKELPQAQNPPGTREARLQRERELGLRLSEEDERKRQREWEHLHGLRSDEKDDGGNLT